MWRKGNPLRLLAQIETGAATVENSMEVPQKIKMEMPFEPDIPLLGIYTKNLRTPISKNMCNPMDIVVLLSLIHI